MTIKKSNRLVLGNWKMNGNILDNAILLNGLKNVDYSLHCDFGVLVPFPYLSQTLSILHGTKISWGAQNLSIHSSGAYTGEVSATMLKEFGCDLVLVGHSERRILYKETNSDIAKKAFAALSVGITPVVCFGETLDEFKAKQTFNIIENQVSSILELGCEIVSRMIFSYEPVWAIGSGSAASPEYVQDIHFFIRGMLDQIGASGIKILYGGSVKSSNAASFFVMPDIDGALVGNASLIIDDFLSITKL
ncbi:triosephosphate isomerase TIM [Candidatus Kinetoplastibacterium oncopeltii TCC290E]|uniref:Triosephosphate isomerase n=1 Tax=Candidatus Kinetoplastidibacterium stringomonadis TCC290E TaxID=1208920 RepID=M1LWP8_9PROT|nr:triose-phosphate isomerase [Candidatus Kinetoplastibacterium oncopeltii]AGF48496.1 triosephosphate isomerase TIM [Candidatus Kinetoplastibacterium oncopeltii TCC290E]